MTELLAPDQFGRLTLLVGAAALALGLVSTPRLQAVIRYYPEWRSPERLPFLRVTAASLINSLVIAAAILLTTGGAILSYFTKEAWYVGFLIAALLWIDARRSFELAFLNGARKQRSAAAIQIADAWSRPVLAIAAVMLLGNSAESALAGYVAASALVLFMLRRMFEGASGLASSPIATNVAALKQQDFLTAQIKSYALPLAPLAIFGWLNGMGDRYILAGMLDMADVGLYAAAYGLASKPFLMLSAVVMQTLRPLLQDAINQKDGDAIGLAKGRMIRLSVAGSALGVLSFFVLSDLAASVFLAREYREAAGLMPWIALGYGLLTISSSYSRFCYAFDGTKYILTLTVASAAGGVLVLIPLVLAYGLAGAAFAVPLRFAIELVLSYAFAKKSESNYEAVSRDGNAS